MSKKLMSIILICFFASTSLFAQANLSNLKQSNVNISGLSLNKPSRVLIPSPAEIFIALDKLGFNPKVFWKDLTRYNKNTKYDSRYSLALNLGVRVADAFVAIQHQDPVNLSKMSQAILTMASQLGVEDAVLSYSDTVNSYLRRNPPDWLRVRTTVEKMRSVVTNTMIDLDDEEIMTLTTIGGWMEGLRVYSKAVERNYTKEAAELIRQPYLIDYYKKRLEALSDDAKSLESVTVTLTQLDMIRSIVDTKAGEAISKNNVKELRKMSEKVTKLIEKGK